MKTFPTKTIAENFSKAAKNYDAAAEVQKLAARKLCEIALPFVKENSQILDLGSGTSFLAREFLNHEQFRQKNVKFYEVDLSLEMLQCWVSRPKENFFAIQADIENLPFQPQSFDLIISSFSLQWLKDFEKTFARIFEILKPNGVFVFCLPTSGSLFELREASLASECNFNFNELPKIENLKSALKKSGFEEKKFVEEVLKQTFENGSEGLKSLKRIGAGLPTKKRNVVSKTQLKQFNNFCLKNFSADNKSTRLSWFVPYFASEKIT